MNEEININTYIDPSTARKNNDIIQNISENKHLPLSIVEINLLSKCNRSCSFCPVSNKDFYTINSYDGRMNMDFFKEIIINLKDINFNGKIIFSGMSEPLIHKELSKFIYELKSSLNNIIIDVVTNGDLVNVKVLKKLFDAGLDTLNISMYDGVHQIDHFTKMITTAELTNKQVILRRRYLEGGNYGITFSNRAGAINIDDFTSSFQKEFVLPLERVCFYPFYTLKIDYNGDIHICSHDWEKRGVVGNLKDNSLNEIWNGKKLEQIRDNLANKNRNMSPCDKCNVFGDVVGSDSFKIWKELKKHV